MKLFVTVTLLIVTLVYAKMEHIPEATVVASNTLHVDMEKVEKLVAEEQAKLLKEKLAHEKTLLSEKFQAEIREAERLNSKRIQLEEKIKHVEEDLKREEERRREMEWRARNPEAVKAQEEKKRLDMLREQEAQRVEDKRRRAEEEFKHEMKVRMEAQKAQNELLLAEKHKAEFKAKARLVGYVLVSAGVGMLACL